MKHASRNLPIALILGTCLLAVSPSLEASPAESAFGDNIRNQAREAGNEVLGGIQDQLRDGLFEPGREAIQRLRPIQEPDEMLADETDVLDELCGQEGASSWGSVCAEEVPTGAGS